MLFIGGRQASTIATIDADTEPQYTVFTEPSLIFPCQKNRNSAEFTAHCVTIIKMMADPFVNKGVFSH